jgi:hypothetical protein
LLPCGRTRPAGVQDDESQSRQQESQRCRCTQAVEPRLRSVAGVVRHDSPAAVGRRSPTVAPGAGLRNGRLPPAGPPPNVNDDNSRGSHNEILRLGEFWRGIAIYAAPMATLGW